MPQPTIRSVAREDPLLTNVSIAYKNPLYIWDQAAPVIKTDKESGRYYIFTQGDWFRDEAKIRAPGDQAPVSGFTLSTSSYACEEYVLATQLPDRILANADAALDLRRANTELVTEKIHLSMERQLAGEVFTTGVWGTDNTTATDWDDYTNSTPLQDVQTAIDTVRLATGYIPNTLVLGHTVFSALRFHPDLTDVIKYTQKGVITPELLAQVWTFEKVLVGRAIYNSAAEGATASYADIWSDNALVCYLPQAPGIMTPSAMYTFVARPFRVRRWYDEPRETEFIEASIIADFVVTGSGLGYFFSDLT